MTGDGVTVGQTNGCPPDDAKIVGRCSHPLTGLPLHPIEGAA
jgi:hypothetical protein